MISHFQTHIQEAIGSLIKQPDFIQASRSLPAFLLLGSLLLVGCNRGEGVTQTKARPPSNDAELSSAFAAFYEKPSGENFLHVRSTLLAHPNYDQDSRVLPRIDQLVKAEKWEEVLSAIDNSMPNLMLSPRAHLHASLSAYRLGDIERGEREGFIAVAILVGIESTGDGDELFPYLACHGADAYDVLIYNGKYPVSQQQVRRDNQKFDVLRTEEGEEYWFDVN